MTQSAANGSLERATLKQPQHQLKNKIERRQARGAVISLGYVGLPLALLFSEQEFEITGFDIDQRKIDTLAQGGSYVYRIAADEIRAAKTRGFSATGDYSRLAEMDAIIICVPTPLNEHHEPDLSFITDTAHAMAPHLRPGQLVVLESTTYPGTTEEVMLPILEKENRLGLKAARGKSGSDSNSANEFFVASVDPFYLSWKAKEYDFRTRFRELAGEINTHMPYHVLASVSAALNGSRVLILGVAYKRDIDDLRESPALVIIELLQKEGAHVSYHDPYFPFIGKGRRYDLQMKRSYLKDLGQYDCVVIVTDHSEYDYQKIVSETQLVVDTRNATGGIRSPKIAHC